MTNTIEVVEQEEIQQLEDSQRDLYLTFHLHNEDYAIAIYYVTEIIGIQTITNVPDMPNFIKGVINLRGRVIPVVDVRLRFGLPEQAYDDRTCIIVVEVDEQVTGLVVDQVEEVVGISAEQVESVPSRSADNRYIGGLGKIGDEMKIILNIKFLVGLVQEASSSLDHDENKRSE